MVNPANLTIKKSLCAPSQREGVQKLSVSVENFQFRFPRFFSACSLHHVDVHLNGSIDYALGVGLVEQVHKDLALLHGNAGIGSHRIAVHELAVGGGDIQLGAVGITSGSTATVP